MQCSCGSWIVPACQIVKSKIDKVPIDSNIFNSINVRHPMMKK